MLGTVLTLLGTLCVIIIIFFLAWYLTRLIAGNGGLGLKGKYISIIEKFPVNKDSYIMLVKAFDKLLLMGVTPGGMTVLKEYDAEDLDIEISQMQGQSFSEVFKKTLQSSMPEGRIKNAVQKIITRKRGDNGEKKSEQKKDH